MPDVVRGALWMLAQAASFAGMIACVRYLSPTIDAAEIVFFRALFGILFQAPWLVGGGWREIAPACGRLVMARSLLLFGGSYTWFIALGMMPLSDAVALQFTLPLFAVIGAALILRERVGLRRAAATLAGFAGALIIIRPGFADVTPAVLIVLGSAALYAGVHLSTKPLAGRMSGSVLILYGNLVTMPLVLVPASPAWVWPEAHQWPVLLAAGFFGMIAHIFMTRAYALADASIVVPIDFTKLLFAALFGWILFNESSDGWTWLGATVIFASTTYITRYEAARERRRGSP